MITMTSKVNREVHGLRQPVSWVWSKILEIYFFCLSKNSSIWSDSNLSMLIHLTVSNSQCLILHIFSRTVLVVGLL